MPRTKRGRSARRRQRRITGKGLVKRADAVAILAADSVNVCCDCRDVVGNPIPLVAGKNAVFAMQLEVNGNTGVIGYTTVTARHAVSPCLNIGGNNAARCRE